MIQLEPREIFVICRQLADPTDTSTYYVRAFIRNAKTDELLDVVDLADEGDQRFRGEYQVPADVSGEGFYITITTKVFTDSGYTTESPNYAREENQYLVQKRYNPILGSGGGDHTDYKKVRKIIQEELKNIRMPKIEKIDLKPVLKSIKNIKIPKQKEPDLKRIIKEIRNVKEEIKRIPSPEKLNLNPVLRKITEIEALNKISLQKNQERSYQGFIDKLKSNYKNLREILSEILSKIKEQNKIRREFLKENNKEKRDFKQEPSISSKKARRRKEFIFDIGVPAQGTSIPSSSKFLTKRKWI